MVPGTVRTPPNIYLDVMMGLTFLEMRHGTKYINIIIIFV